MRRQTVKLGFALACGFAAAWAFGGEDGKAVLRLNGAIWPIESVFSVPGGGEVSLGAKKTLETPFYTLTRRFVKRDDRVDVYDTFLSKTNGLIGVKVRYETPTADFESVYVAGDCNPSSISLRTAATRGFNLALNRARI